jgi:predicted nucleic acid-binding protein
MARKPKALVLDSWSILAFLEDEPAGQQVAEMIADAHESGMPVMMTVVNAGEIWYIMARKTSEEDADRTILELAQLGVQFYDADWKLAREAARFKAKGKMSFADCFAAALAKEQKADLVTGDAEFKQVEGEIRVGWLQER